MRSRLLLALSLTSFAACADTAYPGDEVTDTEVADDGKGDGWLTDQPQGTYSVTGASAGEVVKLTLNADKTFRREIKKAGGNTVVEGKYKFTIGGGNRYIRFLKPNGSTLIDRYGFEMHGRQLKLREVGATGDWQALVANDNFGGVQSQYAGNYTAYGRGSLPDGGVFELMLHDTGLFHMTVEAIHACNAPGHHCPASWSDGYTGSTIISGSWEEATGGVTLTPHNDVTGQDGWKINLAMSVSGTALTVSGKDGSLNLVGPMDVNALFSGDHSIEADQLEGTWSVAKIGTDPDDTVSLWGFLLVLNGAKHKVTFDAETNEMCELSPNVNNAPKCGIYQIAGDPNGGANGVVYAYRGSEFTTLKITSRTASKLKLSDGETNFVLTKL